jgi:phage gp46-like protein
MIKLTHNNTAQLFDVTRSTGQNLDLDEGLETAVNISLFTDARADDDAELPGGARATDRRGWWGDAYAKTKDDKVGSLIWLDARKKLISSTPSAIAKHARAALQWLLDDGVASRLEASASVIGRGCVLLSIDVYRPSGSRWQGRWEVQCGIH